MLNCGGIYLRQTGMVLLISLVFLLVLSLIGLASMQGAVSQQKMTGSVWHRNQSFQSAESGLRLGESGVRLVGATLPMCRSIITCAPPVESILVAGAGTNPVSAVDWVAFKGGLFGMQSLGPGAGLAGFPPETPALAYRVTAVGFSGQVRTVLEVVYARADSEDGSMFRRVLWRQLQ